MTFLYNFGMSQDDAETEKKALDLHSGDKLLCIVSAGEVPLNLLASQDIHIDAADISLPQIYLARLKLNAALHLEPDEAAGFIGYSGGTAQERIRFYKKLKPYMEKEEQQFWDQYPIIFKKGLIHEARFEKYLSCFNWIAIHILNRKKLMRLFEFDDIGLQTKYFDEHLNSGRLRKIFQIVFHPRIYKNRGMDSQGLIHSGERNIAEFFFSRFRNFCTSTPARKNYLLQITFFNHILSEEALPEYLTEVGNQRLKKHATNLEFFHKSITSRLKNTTRGFYNKYALSNVSDWISREACMELLQILGDRSGNHAKVLIRYIHTSPHVPDQSKHILIPDYSFGEKLESQDRYPFYSLIPLTISK